MKRMVKNGDLLDISEEGSAMTFGGNLKVGGTIIANGEIRGGDVSASKFYLGTEEMPLVKANPAGDATGTLEKIKIGNVSYNVGGGGSNDRILNLIAPYSYNGGNLISDVKIYVEDDIWKKIASLYYDTIKVYYNDGKPIGVFHVLNLNSNNKIVSSRYACVSKWEGSNYTDDWFGRNDWSYWIATLSTNSDSTGKFITFFGDQPHSIPYLQKSKFDALYKLADKPTQDGTYVLKATVSGGAVTYTWVAQ